ncbi:MAG TPA: helicase-related protein, partial [Nocardioides sp.]|nr:helicase-related protein [Nocardioides sp.]
ALREAGPVTLVLDECHHLLEVWGRLLVEVLEALPEATVLGLTATPPETLSVDQAALVEELFGDVVYAASIPAVVREGHLAPFVDLIWLTTPSPTEAEWLAGQAERFAELTTQLVDPTFGATPFLVWADLRFHGEVPFARVAAKHPALGDAALRLEHAGLLRLADDVVRGEQHAHAPTADDWALLVDDWYDACVADSVDDRDQDVREALRRALPAIGFQLTRNGIRRGRTAVDRVLARSAAKSGALVEIVGAEHRSLGDRMGMLVICDHEEAAATVGADLVDVLPAQAGSARLALTQLLADPSTSGLAPLMVTGRTVAAAPSVLERLRGEVGAPGLVVSEPDADGIAELTGSWSSRQWVRAVTDFFTAGRCQVLIGTRALLGEGWDAPTATGLVDLSMASTPGAVVQTRGRTLRLDPRDPAKVAVNWTVCCVAEGHPKGDNDWQRTVRKHQGYFGVDATGDVVDGVAHIHPSFSPHTPPPAATFSATNAEMLVRAERRAEVAAAWRVGTPYDDEVRHTVWIRPRRGAAPRVAAPAGALEPPEVVLLERGVRARERPKVWRNAPLAMLGLAAASAVATVALGPLGRVPAALLLGASPAVAASRRRRILSTAAVEADLVQVACALADGLHAAGLTSAGAEGVDWHLDSSGQLRVVLDPGTAGTEQSAVFAGALAEMVAPVGAPRYLVPRYVADDVSVVDGLRPLASYRPDRVVWHPVPTALGVRAELAQAFAAAWMTWVGGGPAIYTGSPVGAGVLAGCRGTDPWAVSSVLRRSWK